MSLAEDAFLERLHGKADRSVELLREAFDNEREAAARAANELDFEPTRSVLHRSAASLGLECGETREAEKLIAVALAGNPPDEIADELRDLLEQVYLQRHLPLSRTSAPAASRRRPHHPNLGVPAEEKTVNQTCSCPWCDRPIEVEIVRVENVSGSAHDPDYDVTVALERAAGPAEGRISEIADAEADRINSLGLRGLIAVQRSLERFEAQPLVDRPAASAWSMYACPRCGHEWPTITEATDCCGG